MSFYQRLQDETVADRQALTSIPFIVEGSQGRLVLDSYTAFLTQAYHHVKHTIPLLMACGGRMPERLHFLRVAIGEYIEEEMGHEEWILDDLRACGVDADLIRHQRPSIETELMVAYAYHSIDRLNPIAFFGMVLVLEGTSVALATHAAGNIQKSLGLPDTAFRYLNSHGALDIGHIDFYRKLMDKVSDAGDQDDIIHAAKVFYRLYGAIFRALPMQKIKEAEQ